MINKIIKLINVETCTIREKRLLRLIPNDLDGLKKIRKKRRIFEYFDPSVLRVHVCRVYYRYIGLIRWNGSRVRRTERCIKPRSLHRPSPHLRVDSFQNVLISLVCKLVTNTLRRPPGAMFLVVTGMCSRRVGGYTSFVSVFSFGLMIFRELEKTV